MFICFLCLFAWFLASPLGIDEREDLGNDAGIERARRKGDEEKRLGGVGERLEYEKTRRERRKIKIWSWSPKR